MINGQTGVLRAAAPADYVSYAVGIPAVIANMNADRTVAKTFVARLPDLSLEKTKIRPLY